MKMDVGLDTGLILYQKVCYLYFCITSLELENIISVCSSKYILDIINHTTLNKLTCLRQNDSLTTYAVKMNSKGKRVFWFDSSIEIECNLRSLIHEQFGVFFIFNNKRVKIIKAKILSDNFISYLIPTNPGQVISTDPFIIACGDGLLEIDYLQKFGKNPIRSNNFIRDFLVIKEIVLV